MKEIIKEKFCLFLDLGIITVPDNTSLASFKKKNRKKFKGYDDYITDKNFGKATIQPRPGQRLHVKVFKQVVSGSTTSEERLAFYKSQNALLIGAQGISLIFEQKREDLPMGYWYLSLDEKEALWEDADGYHRVPGVDRYSGGGWRFSLGCFESKWDDNQCLLCFYLCD